MKYKVITSSTSDGLSEKVNRMLEEGYELVGGLQVVQTHHQLRYSGLQHMDTTIKLTYSQAVVLKDEDKNSSLKEKLDLAIETLETVYKDAEMAIDGEWNKSDEGFADQLTLLDQTLSQIKNK